MFKRKKVKNEPSIKEMTKDVEDLLAVDKKRPMKERVVEFGLKYKLSFEENLISAMDVIGKFSEKYSLKIAFNKNGTVIITKFKVNTWEEGRAWLRKDEWLLFFHESEYFKDKISFTAEKRINGVKIEVKTEATSDLGGIKKLVEMVQEYEKRRENDTA